MGGELHVGGNARGYGSPTVRELIQTSVSRRDGWSARSQELAQINPSRTKRAQDKDWNNRNLTRETLCDGRLGRIFRLCQPTLHCLCVASRSPTCCTRQVAVHQTHRACHHARNRKIHPDFTPALEPNAHANTRPVIQTKRSRPHALLSHALSDSAIRGTRRSATYVENDSEAPVHGGEKQIAPERPAM